MPSFDTLEKKLGLRFHNPELLQQALTHRSYSALHNERLEFLGDSVLGLAISHKLYNSLSGQAEGDLSRTRAGLVRHETLHALAKELGLSPLLRLGEGELKTGGRTRPSILADALEAIIGAVFLDAGFEAANQLVMRLFAQIEFTPTMQAAAKDAKTALQELLQSRRHALPMYTVIGTVGAAHKQTFEVECSTTNPALAERGFGNSRRNAEQEAASKVLAALNKML